MSHAENVRKVFDLMGQLNVSLDDLELYGYVESHGDLTVPAGEAFERLTGDGFQINESKYAEHYYQATSDYVAEALQRLGLMDTGEEREWRVVIEAVDGSGMWQYEFEAVTRESAIDQAHESAVLDGLGRDALWTATQVEAI